MKIAVIGMGYLGTEIVRQIYNLRPECPEVNATCRRSREDKAIRQFDLLRDDIESVLDCKEMELVFISAKVEFTEETCALFTGMRRLLYACKYSRIVYFSSDGVFNGEKGMYTANDPPDSKTLYGGNLALCELLVQEIPRSYLIIRPSYIYGHNINYEEGQLDSRLAKLREDLEAGREIERFSDMYRSPMHVKQVARISVLLGLFGILNGIVHVAGPRASVLDFTRDAARGMGYDPEKIKGISRPNDPKKYPIDTSLDSSVMTGFTGIPALSVEKSFLTYEKIVR
jgi:dTDP-4-dehydrorhamnose reductase